MSRVRTAPLSARPRLGARVVGAGVVLAVAGTLGVVSLSSADTVSDKNKVDAEIAQLRIELEGTSRGLVQAFVALHRTRAQLPGAQQALANAEAARVWADRHNEEVATALAVAEANAAKAADILDQNARDIEEVQDQLGNLARNAYQQGGVSGLSIVLEADSPEDFTDRLIMLDTVTRVLDATSRGLDTLRAEGKAVRAHLVAVHQQVAALKVQAEASLAQATAASDSAVLAKSKLDLLYSAQARYAAGVAARKSAELTNLRRMKARSDALARVLAARARAARGNGGSSLGHGSGFLEFPVGAPVSSEFGMRLHPVLRFWRLHEGIDFAARCGSPVYAAAGGDVIMVRPRAGGYGKQLVVDHGLLSGGVNLVTTYNHLSRFAVTGGPVAPGQLLGYSGNTGISTGCHLHLETRENGIPVNPRLWL